MIPAQKDIGVVTETTYDVDKISELCYRLTVAHREGMTDKPSPCYSQLTKEYRRRLKSRVQFHLENALAGPASGHSFWARHMVQQGWRFGAVHNSRRKVSPLIQPFSDLSINEQTECFLVHAAVRGIAELEL